MKTSKSSDIFFQDAADIEKQRRRLQDLIDSAPGGVFRYGADDDIFDFISQRLLEIFGYTEEEFRTVFHNRFSEMVYIEDRERVLREIAEQGDTDQCEYRIVRKDGTLKWVFDVGCRLTDKNGKRWYYVIVTDVSNEKVMLESIMANLPAGVVIFDSERPSYPLFISEQTQRIFGLDDEKYAAIRNGKIPFDFIPAAELSRIDVGIAINCARPFEVQFPYKHPKGRQMQMRASVVVRVGENGHVLCYATLSDVTEQYLASRERMKVQEISKMLLDDTEALIFEYDVDSDTMRYSIFSGHERLTRFMTDYLGKFDSQSSVHPDCHDEYCQRMRAALAAPVSGKHTYRADYDGNGYRWYRCYYKSVADEQGKVFQIIGRSHDATSEIEASLRLQIRADMDIMSGVYNRTKAEETINARLQAHGTSETHSFLLFDIDNFKVINDTCGHPEGDKVIKAVGRVLQSQFRSDDIIGRMGGDEFAVLFTAAPESFSIGARADKVLANVRDIVDVLHLDGKVSVSAGIAFAPQHGTDFATLFANADKALYHAKRQGRDRWLVYHEGME